MLYIFNTNCAGSQLW